MKTFTLDSFSAFCLKYFRIFTKAGKYGELLIKYHYYIIVLLLKHCKSI